ncbi:hypothetical protein HDU86_002778 [Geranomyces michiganensis]|nr:hypothetical protein HDU86_002778 [Geranomyces michiganensis]
MDSQTAESSAEPVARKRVKLTFKNSPTHDSLTAERECYRVTLQRCIRLLRNSQAGIALDQKAYHETLSAIEMCEDLWPPGAETEEHVDNEAHWAQFPTHSRTRRRRRSSCTAAPTDRRRSSPASFLPSELVTRILFYLEGGQQGGPAHEDADSRTVQVHRDLYSACLVNKHWHQNAIQRLWRNPHIFSPVAFFQLQYCRKLTLAGSSSEHRDPGAAVRRLDMVRFSFSEPNHTPLLQMIPLSFPNLTILRLRITHFTPATLHKIFERCTQIQLLTLRGECERRHGQQDEQWGNEDEFEAFRVGLSRLTALCLNTVVLSHKSAEFYSVIAKAVGANLRHLNLGRTYCDDDVVLRIARQCPNLQTIILEENTVISTIAISELALRCRKLCFVKLRNAIYVEDAGVVDLVRNCADLALLGISYTQCGDVTLDAITQHADKLQTLYMNDLSVSETALCELLKKRGPQLRTLGMASLDIMSERVLCEIAQHCSNLRRLDLSGCEGGMTDDLADMLVSRLPKLEAMVLAGIDEISDDYITNLGTKVATDQFWLAPPPELT